MTQVVPLAVSTTCAARASIKAGVNVRSQRLLSATASEEEAATFRGCDYYWGKKIQIIHGNQAGSVPYRKSVSLNLAVCANFLEGCAQRGFFFF